MSKFSGVLLLLVALTATGVFAADSVEVESVGAVETGLFKSKCNLKSTCFKKRHYYFETSMKRTQADAAKHCISINMNLYTIENCEEDSFITNLLKTEKSCGTANWWTSGYKTVDGNWLWENGQAIVYSNWKLGQPEPTKNIDYCIELRGSYLQWQDAECQKKNYYICKGKPMSC